jgi:lipopolysaccharide biosynthesis glycosyltransferase
MRIRKEMTNTVYIGYDSREHTAYEVLKFSIERIATKGVRVVPIKKDVVSRMGLYTRKSNSIGGQSFDEIDGRPFSTDFSFTRFLVPHLNMYQGLALYMDCDMYIRTDITELFDMCQDNYYPLWCVKHKYEPPKGTKMDGKAQEPYARKNWSSLMMFNCSHHYNEKLTVDAINTQTGRWLHTFQWLPDKEADIGTLPEEWNWLDGHSPEKLEAKNVHFTTGGPWFKNWGGARVQDNKYAVEWCNDAKWLKYNGILPQDKDYLI